MLNEIQSTGEEGLILPLDPFEERALSKRERKKLKKIQNRTHRVKEETQSLVLPPIEPITNNQRKLFYAYEKNQNMFLHGAAGTGKTFLSLYLSLVDVLEKKLYDKILIVRSLVPSRDIGFLPGNVKEKAAAYEDVYHGIFAELFNKRDAYDSLKRFGTVEFVPTSFTRGATFKNCIVIIDEMQNLTFEELNTIITRVGENCKLYLCGDIRQTDLNKKYDRSGLQNFSKIVKNMKSFSCIEFGHDDIVRSEFLKEYITTKDQLIDSGDIELNTDKFGG